MFNTESPFFNIINSSVYNNADLKLLNNKIIFYKNQLREYEIDFFNIDKINDIVPTDINNAFNLIQNEVFGLTSITNNQVTSNDGTTSSAVSQAFSNAPTFTAFPLVMAQKQITTPLTITVITRGAIAGASVLMRLIADGVLANTPVFVGAEQVTGSSGWDNRAGIINLVQMQFDGTDFYFSIVQKALGSVLDLQVPAFVSSAINAAGTIATLTFNEDLLATSVPTSANFTGVTVTSATILNKVVTLNISPAVAVGTTNIVYSGTSIKDLAGNASLGFTTAVTVAPSQVITLVNLSSRNAGINEFTIGTYVAVTGGNWKPAMTASPIFAGDKTFEMTASSGTFGQGIIGLEATSTTAATLGDWPNLDLGMAWYGGNYQAMQQGQGQVPCGNYQNGDLIRMVRVAGIIKAQRKRGSTDWLDLFAFPNTINTALFPVIYLNDATSQTSLVIY
ncbi:Ig-like domain-containing protein [Flavobacterium sp.]|uniref:Ig-like domain-containing protein n=1 Tax=Flavobacterium sp. TaxID=239 RepID=UPI003750695C